MRCGKVIVALSEEQLPDLDALMAKGVANGVPDLEIIDPRRLITTSLPVDGGDWPLVSVKIDPPIPKDMMLQAMDEITGVRVQAPIKVGDILMRDLLGTGSDVIATRNVKTAWEQTTSHATRSR